MRITLLTTALIAASAVSAQAKPTYGTITGRTYGCDHIRTAVLAYQAAATNNQAIIDDFVQNVGRDGRCRLLEPPRVEIVVPDTSNFGWTCIADKNQVIVEGPCFFVPSRYVKY